MPTSLNKYLDPPALDETVLNIKQIAEQLEADMQDLPYARPDGIYPEMTVGAVIGADETAQWATRESTGSGAATVRSVQGAAVAFNQMRDVSGFVRDVSRVIAGHVYYFSAISAADADVPSGGYIRWRLYTMSDGVLKTLATLQFTESGAHKLATRFTSSYNAVSDGTSGNTEGNLWTYRDVVGGASGNLGDMMLIDLTQMFGSGNEPTTVAEFEAMYPESYYPYSAPTLKPVQIAGIASTDAQGGELDAIEWTAQTLRAAGSVADELTAGELVTRVGVLTLTGNEPASAYNYTSYSGFLLSGALPEADMRKAYSSSDFGTAENGTVVPNTTQFAWLGVGNTSVYLLWADCPYATAADLTAWLQQRYAAGNPVTFFYELNEPTTQPISPALPMTYKVQQGGSESIIVPAGEVSAPPVLTVAEPVNAGDEFARIWAAIQSLGYTRNTAQLSRPVSLTDIGSIDKVQKDTTELDTTKEVTE